MQSQHRSSNSKKQINKSADQVDQLISGSKGSRHDLRAYNNDTPVDRARPGKTTRQIGI